MRTDRSPEPRLTTARSWNPSLLKSATSTVSGALPTRRRFCDEKTPPAGAPGRMETLLRFEHVPVLPAVPGSEKEGDVTRFAVRDGKILPPVAIEVCHRHRGRPVACPQARFAAEGPVTVSHEEAELTRFSVADHQVPVSVAVEVSDGGKCGAVSGIEAVLRRECPVASPQSHGGLAMNSIHHHQIQRPVPVQFSDHGEWHARLARIRR